jgi:hypothetical protein
MAARVLLHQLLGQVLPERVEVAALLMREVRPVQVQQVVVTGPQAEQRAGRLLQILEVVVVDQQV